MTKERAPRNRTLSLTETETSIYARKAKQLTKTAMLEDIENTIIHQDLFEVLPLLPDSFVDLLFIDPPYNLSKTFNKTKFSRMKVEEYTAWMDSWFQPLLRLLKPNASVYICSDWLTSQSVFAVASQYLTVRNRITWEREKGRGAKTNWKNASEDIWFFTVGDAYTFHVDDVKLKRRVIAPYKDDDGKPKDWQQDGKNNFRLTYPSNLWTDLTVPFWSMPENTDHPTQKPEKLLAKVILASSSTQDLVFDPFVGAGTTAVVAKKLGRRYVGIDIDEYYVALAEKRLEIADASKGIQGYFQGVFWERNTLSLQQSLARGDSEGDKKTTGEQLKLLGGEN